MTATDTAFLGISEANSRRHASLKQALMLGLRQKIWIAVCDDSNLRRAIAGGLPTDLSDSPSPGGDRCPTECRVPPNWVTLDLDPADPDPVAHIRRWKAGHRADPETSPVGFQILGVERLTRQPPAVQRSFLGHLRTLPRQVIEFDCSLLLWLPSPWLGCIRQSAPEFWRWRADLFEFVGDPTPPQDAIPPAVQPPEIGRSRPPSLPSETDLKHCMERGRLYRDRIRDGTASTADLDGAIRAYEQILATLEAGDLPPGDDPDVGECDRVALCNDLGTFHWMRFQHISKPRSVAPDDAISHLEQSIIFYQKAIAKIRPETSPTVYVKLLKNLGAAHADLATIREPVENLQQSVVAYEEAARLLRSSPDRGAVHESNEMDSIDIQNNLGTAHWNLAQYVQPVAHLKAAIAAYTEALRGYTPVREPVRHAMIQTNLGTAYWNLAQHQPSKRLLRRAIRCYRQALTHRTPAVAPLACAMTQNNLGTACWHLALYLEPEDRMKSLQEAIAAYETALTLARQLGSAQLTFDTLATHNNLGLAHYRLATDRAIALSQADQVSHLEMALHHHAIAGGLGQAPPGNGNPDPPAKIHPPDSERHRVASDPLIRTLRAFYEASGWRGQNQALSHIPGHLLPEIWRSL